MFFFFFFFSSRRRHTRLQGDWSSDVCSSDLAMVDLIFVAWVAAEQKVIQIQAVNHDLVANQFDGAHAVERCRGIGPSGALLQHCGSIYEKQDQQNAEDKAEAGIKLLTDRHCEKPPLAAAMSVLCERTAPPKRSDLTAPYPEIRTRPSALCPRPRGKISIP